MLFLFVVKHTNLLVQRDYKKIIFNIILPSLFSSIVELLMS
jgi:hypothetical protein